MSISYPLANHLFEYDPGDLLALRWRNPPRFSNVKPGSIAGRWKWKGTPRRRYRVVGFGGDKTVVAVIRVVWVLFNKKEPRGNLILIDKSIDDLRIENIREKLAKPEFNKKSDEIRWDHRYQNLKKLYGITPEEYSEIAERQTGVCAICGQPETMVRRGKIELLSVDHCHATNRVRGLLCANCNNGLGRFKDDPERLRKAADYIERDREKERKTA